MSTWIRKVMISTAAAATIALLCLFLALVASSSSLAFAFGSSDSDPDPRCDTGFELASSANVPVQVSLSTDQDCVVPSYRFVDAGFGTGLSCPRFGIEEMLPRAELLNVADVDEPTVLFDSHFDEGLSDIIMLSGDWNVANSALNQNDHCGSDLTALLDTEMVEHFELEAEFSSIDTANNAGLTFGYASVDSRSGATLVDLTDGGQRLRWGYYNETGYYQYMGSRPVPAVAVGETITMTIQVRNGQVDAYLNGVRIAGFVAENTQGQTGLTTTKSAVAFDRVELTALPSSLTTSNPDQSRTEKVGANRNISSNITPAG